MLTAQEALIQLQEGNQRFVEGKSTYNTMTQGAEMN